MKHVHASTPPRSSRTIRGRPVGAAIDRGIRRTCGTASSIRDDALYDDDGTRWLALDGDLMPGGIAGVVFTQVQLAEIRGQCRALAAGNAFAINGHENRISYIVGSGHTLPGVAGKRAVRPTAAGRTSAGRAGRVRPANKWHKRQQEIVRRKDRDGECFLRLFAAADGTTRVRFVEPGQVATPPERSGDPAAGLGHSDRSGRRGDGPRLLDRRPVGRRRRNPAPQGKRGRQRASRAAAVFSGAKEPAPRRQAAAEHERRGRDPVGNRLDPQASGAPAGRPSTSSCKRRPTQASVNPVTGRTSNYRRYAPGTILDALAGDGLRVPRRRASTPASYVAVLQAELRAIAARLVMPEFMFTSDASNANYASTMVAEGPAVKMFDRLQQDMIEDDLELM